ncbi:uncharacterized protein [Musca autumnalis]|uniref:uncharacterized protein n=1 Tax=Musca autumnalis TaxID=221902 RepID=UPI003CF35267
MSMEEFLLQCDEITSFEEELEESDAAIYNEAAIDAEKAELQRIWGEWRDSYKKCIGDPECAKRNKDVLKSKKKKMAHQTFIKCTSILGDRKGKVKVVPSTVSQKLSSSVAVPPCDTEVFYGDYASWPSFRDLFTAIYATNKKLSPVEKLYHLFQKTAGEAREINRHIPMTSDGFTLAWDNLRNQYENKRILINSQLRILFNLAQCGQETAGCLKKLQRDVTNCISVLELYKVDVKSWDPIFVYQCSSKMPKLTLSLWEQSLENKTELPHWDELNKFLTDRFQALESIADITASNGTQPNQGSRPKLNQYDRSKQFKVHHTRAFVVPEITGNIPSQPLDTISLDRLPEMDFADPKFYESGPVDILLGGDVYPVVLLSGVKKDVLGSLLAQETVFGWILTGPATSLVNRQRVSVSHCTRIAVKDELVRFWEIEEVPRVPVISVDDRRCEEIFLSTTVRGPDGRYIVDLPFRSDLPFSISSKSSRYVALSQFLRNEMALARCPERKQNYDEVIMEYLTLGHMEQVKGLVDYEDCFYLPHHGVFKPESSTTKLRVVFNASCPSVDGKSLNDALYVGPSLQKDIVSLVLNWRVYRYVFNADITKMYRQIWINPEHTRYQRILFRSSLEDEIADYRLKTVTFGVNCAPYLALRTLLKLAEDEEHRYSVGSKILRNNMYVDDALVGVHTISDGIKARESLINILRSAGFELRKWASNSKEILRGLSRCDLLNEEFLELGDKSSAKTLGIRWNASSDSFYFVMDKIEERSSYSKRQVLSIIAKIFDPLGWLSPIVVTAKILMQNIWLDDIGWDDPLKPLSLSSWKTFVSNVEGIEQIAIPRWVEFSPGSKIELHGFCDSSESAYAAALKVQGCPIKKDVVA